MAGCRFGLDRLEMFEDGEALQKDRLYLAQARDTACFLRVVLVILLPR